MPFPSRFRRTTALLAVLAAPLVAQGPAAGADSANSGSAAAHLRRVQAELVQEAVIAYRARVVATLPGWQSALRDVERLVDRPWIGLPPVILVVPSAGGRGFACAERDTCLGRFSGANVTVRGTDTTMTALSSLILIAESAVSRRDVWLHELTHALLTQHGMLAESARHDRRYFGETQFVRLEF
jgi:hypothetical protein